MKIRIEIDEKHNEDEIVIRCSQFNNEIRNIQKALNDIVSKSSQIVFYKNNTEYFLSLDDILFFETEELSISAHTVDNVYQVKYKLYELEDILPDNFMRVSKSTILNVKYIFSITRNLTASSIVEFQKTHKKVYVSRHYYKPLKSKMLEVRR